MSSKCKQKKLAQAENKPSAPFPTILHTSPC